VNCESSDWVENFFAGKKRLGGEALRSRLEAMPGDMRRFILQGASFSTLRLSYTKVFLINGVHCPGGGPILRQLLG
jgi:hypothetical protein